MPRLYRSSQDLQNWYAFLETDGWMRFPAKVNGWHQRQPVQGLHALGLREVPLWLSFHTGLLEAETGKSLRRAA